MRILSDDRKRGLIKLLAQTPDDLWHLSTLIESGDLCTGRSEYKEKLGSGEKTKAVRKSVWVRLRVEKVELDGGRLRISGAVEDGSEQVPRGSHHGIDIAPGDDLEILKERWQEYQLARIEEATRSSVRTLIVLFDREEALFALLRPSGHEIVGRLRGDVPKKGLDEGKTKSFAEEIARELEQIAQRCEAERIIAGSAPFWHEYLRRALAKDVVGKTVFVTASTVDPSEIGHMLARPEVQQQLTSERSAQEAAMIERMLAALAKDKLCYGRADLAIAISDGNLSELFVSEQALQSARAEGTAASIEQLLRSAEGIGATVHLITTEDAKRRIDGLGGAAGIVRW